MQSNLTMSKYRAIVNMLLNSEPEREKETCFFFLFDLLLNNTGPSQAKHDKHKKHEKKQDKKYDVHVDGKSDAILAASTTVTTSIPVVVAAETTVEAVYIADLLII